MPAILTPSIVVAIFKAKGDIKNCSCYKSVKLLGHGMNVVGGVLDNELRRIVFFDEIQFTFMSEKGTIDTIFIFRKLQ